MAILFALAALPLMRYADAPPTDRQDRVSSIDGVRGFLAFGVYFHHVVITYPYVTRGTWDPPRSHFYRLAGPLAVDIFFMITGYLFWAKAIKGQGRMDLLKLYVGRAFRIGPLYLFAICVMLAILAIRTNFRLHEPVRVVVAEVSQWLALGVLSPTAVNAYQNTNNLMAGVTWTLHYEWLFYFSLGLTSVLARLNNWFLLIGVGSYCIVLWSLSAAEPGLPESNRLSAAALFLAGMICASLEAKKLLLASTSHAKSIALLSLIALIFLGSWLPNTVVPLFLACVVFYLLISGSTCFGLLTTRAALRLGNISYGIYLLQGLVLTTLLSFSWVRHRVLATPARYWAFAFFAGIALMVFATAAHVGIERPGIRLGSRVAENLAFRIRRLRGQPASA
jgi:peptidoglycan/LPS O-acetylase OafA/YrhL